MISPNISLAKANHMAKTKINKAIYYSALIMGRKTIKFDKQ
jgi:hypothetical protein